ncbi:MAG: phosphate regulon sensor histidine kinase PhoR [gamma proteobacterium symbiont of Bathyaustriella thionipta]|nr:phosphate regulon sensor histidine kinase PhoR [gamma proteobacterium symbiont of Bathyaustriella thionipta]MCU7949360.1 phosphate regulon sensor histidine kinase PhoR [gamma proteobacterium symbiont of Bathyaustriella thionipta]MCU7954675.1 phosphate regulon sensor histidine kinase PhoR [gamma proteobacterium symbiont of Bathyaustriella thionipta]MCU7955959.1 phosphate regulon sensor histidine kinase PhoR [gamma proteobacterium symbiont of Bathyaustriella thionipta]MCU7968183.1 phosphate re
MNSNKLILVVAVELLIILLLLSLVTYFGSVTGNGWHAFSLGLLLYLIWHFFQLSQLIQWLRSKKFTHLALNFGMWREIFKQLTLLQQTSRTKQKKLIKFLDNYRAFFNVIPDSVVILNHDNEIEWFNKNAQLFLGLKKKKSIGKNILKVLKDPTLENLLSKKAKEENIELHSPVDKNKIFSIRVIPYIKNSRLLLARDISRIYWIDKTRKDFIANVSHELRTPLTVISGYLETFETRFAQDETFLHPIQTMQQQSHRMENLIQDLLILSKLEANTSKKIGSELLPVPIIIKTIINDTRVINLEKQHQINMDLDEHLMIAGNEIELQSVFTNLISNAIHYTPAKGIINILWYQKNNKAYFSVKDNGEGIESQHLQRLTERFYRIDKGRSRSEGGTGLGLSIVKHIINHHQATLEIESKVGKGSQFTCIFTLPK